MERIKGMTWYIVFDARAKVVTPGTAFEDLLHIPPDQTLHTECNASNAGARLCNVHVQRHGTVCEETASRMVFCLNVET
jgi:hypothetical protein